MTLSCGDVYRIIPQLLAALRRTRRQAEPRREASRGVRPADGRVRPRVPRPTRSVRARDAAPARRPSSVTGHPDRARVRARGRPSRSRRRRREARKPDRAPGEAEASCRPREIVVRREAARSAAGRTRELRRFTRRARRRRIAWLTAAALVVAARGGCGGRGVLAAAGPADDPVDGTARLDPVALKKPSTASSARPLAAPRRGRITRRSSERSRSSAATRPRCFRRTRSRSTSSSASRSASSQTATKFDLVDPAGSWSSRRRPAPRASRSSSRRCGEVGDATLSPMTASVLLALPPDVLARVDAIRGHTGRRDARPGGQHQRVVWGSADARDRRRPNSPHLLQSAARAREYDVSSPGASRRVARRGLTARVLRGFLPTRGDAPGRGEAQPYPRNRLARNTLNLN